MGAAASHPALYDGVENEGVAGRETKAGLQVREKSLRLGRRHSQSLRGLRGRIAARRQI